MMPYESTQDLPKPVKANLPKGAQQTYVRAFNKAWEEYARARKLRGRATREETSHCVAWSAVKGKHKKEGKRWVRKA
jgi:cation transport regulator